jgi:hypothetical protein
MIISNIVFIGYRLALGIYSGCDSARDSRIRRPGELKTVGLNGRQNVPSIVQICTKMYKILFRTDCRLDRLPERTVQSGTGTERLGPDLSRAVTKLIDRPERVGFVPQRPDRGHLGHENSPPTLDLPATRESSKKVTNLMLYISSFLRHRTYFHHAYNPPITRSYH